jgi:hypothetical protein
MRIFWAGSLALLTLTPAWADTLPSAIEACASLRRDGERLACYDRAVAAVRTGEASPAPPTAENMFGANAETVQSSANSRDVKREELQQISGSVTSLRYTNDGMMVLELDNGQVWRQQDQDVRLSVSQGDPVTISRASLGTFRIGDKTGRFARFKRVR